MAKRIPLIRVHLGAFDYTIVVVFSKDLEAVARLVRKRFEDPKFTVANLQGRRGCCLSRADFCPIIWMPRRPRTPVEYGTLAHEAFHAVGHALRWANIPFTEESEEAYTHCLAKVIREILSHA